MMGACVRNVLAHVPEAAPLQDRIDALALGDRTVARDVTSALIDTNRATLLYMLTAYEGRAWEALGRAAHRLAGSLRMLQCSREIALALRLERAALEHDVLSVEPLLPFVIESVAALNDELDALLD
jgi:HPt (histidine-containing phosphotransfer) domain-containing protein